MIAYHPGITQEIGGSLGAVPLLLPSETASRILSWRRFLIRKHQLDMIGYFSTEELIILVWNVSQKFSEKKTYWILFLRNKYLVIFVLPLLLQSEEDLWDVPVGSS